MAAKPKTDPTGLGAMLALGTITVTAPGGPRRRAGMRFDTTTTVLRLADLNEGQMAALRGDPMLHIGAEDLPEAREEEIPQGG